MLTRDNAKNRRSGIERREFSYSFCFPERRSGQDRRQGYERRKAGWIDTGRGPEKQHQRKFFIRAA